MHILFLGNGASPNTIHWVRYFAEVLNHRMTVVSFDPVSKPIPGVEVIDRSGSTKLKYFYRIPYVRRLVRDLQPDLLVGYRVTSYGFTAACSGFHPFVVAAMGRDVELLDASPVKRWAASFAVRRADLIHSWAPKMTERLVALGADPARILTLPRGVNTDLFYPKRRNSGGRIRILSTRSLDPYYRIDVIVRAVSDLLPKFSDVECSLIGDGPERGNLERLAEALGIRDRMFFPGRLEYPEVADSLRESDIYVSAVPTDGTSSSLLEAMASGVFPVVVDNDSNRVWVRHGENGFLYPAGNAAELARLLEAAITHPDLRSRAAAANIDEIRKRGDWKTNMSRMENRQLELCGGRKPEGKPMDRVSIS